MENTDSEKGYQVALNGEGLTINQSVDKNTALAIIQIVMGGALPTTGALQPASSSVAALRRADSQPNMRMSLRGYIDQVGAKNIAAKIVAIAAFLRDFEGKEEFTREDIGARFKGAGEAPPTNLPRDIQTAIRNGWIAEDHRNKGFFFITTDGDEALRTNFEGARASTGRRRRKKKAGAGNKEEAGNGEE